MSDVDTSSSAEHLYYTGAPGWTDVYIEVSLTLTQAASSNSLMVAGVTVRSNAPNLAKDYHFCGVSLTPGKSGTLGFSYLYTSSSTPIAGLGMGPHQLRVRARGSSLSCWLAGKASTTTFSWTSSLYPSGTVELMTQGMAARFHDIKVYGFAPGCP